MISVFSWLRAPRLLAFAIALALLAVQTYRVQALKYDIVLMDKDHIEELKNTAVDAVKAERAQVALIDKKDLEFLNAKSKTASLVRDNSVRNKRVRDAIADASSTRTGEKSIGPGGYDRSAAAWELLGTCDSLAGDIALAAEERTDEVRFLKALLIDN